MKWSLFALAAAAVVDARRVIVYSKHRSHTVRVVEKSTAEGEFEMEDHAIYPFGGTTDLVAAVTGSRVPTSNNNGSGVAVFVLDSGCQADHPMFQGVSVSRGKSFVTGEPDTGVDSYGHGTHVLGDAVQISPGADFTCVRIFSSRGSGTAS